MSDAEQTCLRATRLFALAIIAREDGNSDYANELTKLASEAFDHEFPTPIPTDQAVGIRYLTE